MSTSEPTDFDAWLVRAFAETGAFTALVVLVEIGDTTVVPLASTYFHIIGDESTWADMTLMLAGSGQRWDGAAFFPVTSSRGGPLDNVAARGRLKSLEAEIVKDRLHLNRGEFFDAWGRRLRIDELKPN